MKAIGRWQSLFMGALALTLSVTFVAPSGAQERRGEDQAAAAALSAQRAATAESILAAKEEALGEPFDAKIRASLKSRMETLSVEQLAGLAQMGADADIMFVLGSVTSDLVYTPVTPCRVFDSRISQGGPGPIAANGTRNLEIAGTAGFPAQGGLIGGCGVPVGATSAIINFVTVTPSGAGDIRAWAVANPQPGPPLAAIMNYGVVTGLAAIANGVAVPLCNPAATSCALGDLRLQADVSGTEILGDVVGYFSATVVPTLGSVAKVQTWVGFVGTVVGGSVYKFVGGSTLVVVATGQRLIASAEAPMGITTGTASARIDICHSVGAGALTNFSGGGYSIHTMTTDRRPYSATGSKPLGAGTYNIGMCINTSATTANSDYVNGWVQVINVP